MSAVGSQTFVFSGSLGVREAARVGAELHQALSGSDTLLLDCSGLTQVDLSIIQLLAAAHKTAVAAGKVLRLITPTGDPLAALLRQAGFVSADGRPLTPEGQFWINAEGKAA